MREVYNAKYYTLDLVPKYHHEFIDIKLKWFIDLLGLKDLDWPIDCTKVIKRLKGSQDINFEYGFSELPHTCDATTQYLSEHSLYLLLINKSKVNYPFECSKDRRLNFTLAHEMAHIALEHLLIPRSAKSSKDLAIEEAEADEFAGRLLMPEKLLYSCNYYSLQTVSSYFNVSKTALWQRLNNIKRLDLLHSKKVKTCTCCGNTKFSAFAEYCGICGTPLSAEFSGIKQTYYPEEIPMDKYKRVKECPLCKSTKFSGDKCAVCGTYIFNFCSDYLENGEEGCTNTNLGNSRFCEICGKPTYYYKRRFLKTWNDTDDKNSVEVIY